MTTTPKAAHYPTREAAAVPTSLALLALNRPVCELLVLEPHHTTQHRVIRRCASTAETPSRLQVLATADCVVREFSAGEVIFVAAKSMGVLQRGAAEA